MLIFLCDEFFERHLQCVHTVPFVLIGRRPKCLFFVWRRLCFCSSPKQDNDPAVCLFVLVPTKIKTEVCRVVGKIGRVGNTTTTLMMTLGSLMIKMWKR